MASVNRVILLGNCGQAPEVRYLASGECVANVSLATSERFKDKKTGESREVTEWSRLTFYGRLAEIVRDYIQAGSQIYVEGKMKTDKYTDKNGIERQITKVVCNNLTMLGSPKGQKEQENPQAQQQAINEYEKASAGTRQSHQPVPIHELDDDIPF